jgi:nanoRNase/pAp phosphatase (c-di-AMP/oligoRNAs hydrolase)
MVYMLKDDSYIFPIRGNDSCKVHLGKVVDQISSEIGGSGGGHEKASGAEKFNGSNPCIDRPGKYNTCEP